MAERSLQSDPASTDFTPGSPVLAEDAAADRPRPVGPTLFEISWEVCNQVGGIYQVLRSKAPLMTQRWGEQYYLVGPWEESKATLEYEEMRPTGWIARAVQQLKDEGLTIHYGRWLVPGRPRVLLIEHWQGDQALADVKASLWNDFNIETPGQDWLIDGVVSFSQAVFRLFKALGDHRPTNIGGTKNNSPLLAHFHEWLGGLAIPMIRKADLPVATVFTTHATLLGRYIASSRENFYEQLPWIDEDLEATRFNVRSQHKIERACAHGSHVFTTVSSITAEECTQLLGRPVDVVVPNGLTVGLYNAGHEQQRLHGQYKDDIHRFTMGHFFPSYSFDLDRTVYMFSSGRYEPRNKGFDLCLDALAKLNVMLKQAQLGKTVVFFIVTKKATKSINPLAMEKRGVLNELNDVCEKITEGVGKRLFERAAAGGKLRMDDLIDEYWMLRYKRAQHALKQACLPMVVTHMLEDDINDPVLNQIRQLGLINREEDPVKVVYVPDFINPTNRLFGIEYDQFVRGCHMGVFPSQYEPWGYTPLEAAAMGVPAITSDLAGFGRYVQENFQKPEEWGMTVLKRRGRPYKEAADDLADRLFDYCKLERRERIAMRNEVDRRSWEFDWSKLGRAYHTAHDLAIARFEAEATGGVAMVSAAVLSQRSAAAPMDQPNVVVERLQTPASDSTPQRTR